MFMEGLKGTLMAKLEGFSALADLTESSRALQSNSKMDWLRSPADTLPRHAFIQTLHSGDPLSFAHHR